LCASLAAEIVDDSKTGDSVSSAPIVVPSSSLSRFVVPNDWRDVLKTDSKGDPARFKVRLVKKGFTQIFGIGYVDTASPTVSKSALRLFIAIADARRYILCQIDIKLAFIQGKIDYEVYVEQAPGFDSVESSCSSHVYRLKKALYSLKQSPLSWIKTLTAIFADN
jgi:Reverse transcriptase (RNA-dependent DNA polymerase)